MVWSIDEGRGIILRTGFLRERGACRERGVEGDWKGQAGGEGRTRGEDGPSS